MDCIFCKIVSGEIPSGKVFPAQSGPALGWENVVAFNDINPKATIHILIVPKKHIESVKTLEDGDKNLVGEMFLVAKKIAEDKNLSGYKLIMNVGRDGGQLVDHLHLHLLGGNIEPNSI
jgi:histidine triad (HIT) family protein